MLHFVFVMNNIYFDHSATTPVDEKVLKKMFPYFSDRFGNPSSIHSFGQTAIAGVDVAREQVASFLNCNNEEVIFTSGATESDNLAIYGVIRALKKKGIDKPHIITTMIEHDAVLEPCMYLEKEGVEVTYLQPKSNGVVSVNDFKKAVQDNTVLVSIMYVNSEVGSVQPIREIAKEIKKINEKRLKDWKNTRPAERTDDKPQEIYFHTDATQALNFCNCDVKWNYIDLLSLSSHKIYGPKGVGVLYIRKGVNIEPLQRGGHHERNIRSGTLNVAGIVGLGAAVELLGKRKEKGSLSDKQIKENKKIEKLRDMLVEGVIKNVPDVNLNTDRKISTPAHAHFTFLGIEGESILMGLDLKGVAVSTGSACASASLKASHVLLAMGIKKEIAHSSIRFSLGKLNTEDDIKRVIKILPPIIKKLRKISTEYNS